MRDGNLLPDTGAICSQEAPPWQHAADGHRIFCHIPLETLAGMEAVVQTSEAH